MTESSEHARLLARISRFVQDAVGGTSKITCRVDGGGTPQPKRIGKFRPDLRAAGTTKSGKIEIIGEAETDLDKHAIEQLTAFIQYVERYPWRALVVAVPHRSKVQALRLLQRRALNWGAVSGRVVILGM